MYLCSYKQGLTCDRNCYRICKLKKEADERVFIEDLKNETGQSPKEILDSIELNFFPVNELPDAVGTNQVDKLIYFLQSAKATYMHDDRIFDKYDLFPMFVEILDDEIYIHWEFNRLETKEEFERRVGAEKTLEHSEYQEYLRLKEKYE